MNSISDDLDFDEGGGEKTREEGREKSEKKGDSGKAMAGIQRTRKDEKKATKDNDFLFEIIVDILKNKDYDVVIPLMIDLLRIGVPSNIVIGIISLIFNEAVYIIRNHYSALKTSIKTLNKEEAEKFEIILSYDRTNEVIEFDDNNINEFLKNRINEWIEDIINVISFDPSTIMTNKFFILIKDKTNKDSILNFTAGVFTFFLYNLNISISKDKAMVYSEFIISEVMKKLKEVTLEEI